MDNVDLKLTDNRGSRIGLVFKLLKFIFVCDYVLALIVASFLSATGLCRRDAMQWPGCRFPLRILKQRPFGVLDSGD